MIYNIQNPYIVFSIILNYNWREFSLYHHQKVKDVLSPSFLPSVTQHNSVL